MEYANTFLLCAAVFLPGDLIQLKYRQFATDPMKM